MKYVFIIVLKKMYLFIAKRNKKCGASSRNIGCDWDSSLFVTTAIPSIIKWVNARLKDIELVSLYRRCAQSCAI